MKIKHLPAALTAMALALAGCTQDELKNNPPVAAQVTADICNVATRATNNGNGASFAENDIIYVVASETETHAYSKTSTGSWDAGTDPYYFQTTDPVNFMAWYATPTTAGKIVSNAIPVNTASQKPTSTWNELDILVAPKVSSSVSQGATVSFTGTNAFTHLLSQMKFTFKTGNGITDLTALTNYKLTGINVSDNFNVLTCALEGQPYSGDVTVDLSQTTISGTEYADQPILLLPQAVTDGKLSLEVTYNQQTYKAELSLPQSATELKAGYSYIFTVTINNTALVVSDAEIADWIDGGSSTGNATMD